MQIDCFGAVSYHASMIMNRGARIFRLTLLSLLSLWVFFGCLELLDESQIIPAIAEDAQEGQDYDEEALAQLASGLKSDLLLLEPFSSIRVLSAVVQPAVTPSTKKTRPCAHLVRHGPFSLPLYQQLSVYRI